MIYAYTDIKHCKYIESSIRQLEYYALIDII